ncbi:MAG: DNA-methyltransferase [Candidatus Heimdallarchaeaceae archaeon]
MTSDSRLFRFSKPRKTKYIPGLAAFYFDPTNDWTKEDAKRLYQQSKHPIQTNEIFYEDCIEGMKKLPDESIDLIIADPPFGIEFDSKELAYNRNSDFVVAEYQEIDEDYDIFTEMWIRELPRIMKKTASAYIFSGWNNLEFVLSSARKAKLELINHIIWTYQFGVFTKRKFVNSHYHILFYVKNPKKYYFNKIHHYPLDSWNIPRKYKRGENKNCTKLPIQLVKKLIDFSSQPGDLILDPFMGNGTTAIVAKGSYRHYVGFEINTNLKNTIENNLSSIKLGQLYSEYKTLKPSILELRKKYPRAYKIYCKLEGINEEESENGNTKRRSG